MSDSPLGKRAGQADQYSPELLCSIPRDEARRSLGIHGEPLPFSGVDIWTAYEVSWLNRKGKPVVSLGELRFPITAPNIVESKSLKLYLNSLSGMRYGSDREVARVIRNDLERVSGGDVDLRLGLDPLAATAPVTALPGTCIDGLDVQIQTYEVDADLLTGSTQASSEVAETLHSHLLKSNCPVTGQPDWGSVMIRYRGDRIDYAALLRYLVSFRNHREFHEQCVERMFMDIQRGCHPSQLTVYARYTRRGGLDINPFRSNFEDAPENARLWRQ